MQLIERTLRILELLSAESNGLSISQISERLSISTSATHRILTCLKEQLYVYQDSENKKYKVGYKTLTLSNNITEASSLINQCHGYMVELEKKTGMTVALCIREGNGIVCIDYVEGRKKIITYVRTGFAMPLHSTSAGKILCSYLPEDQVYNLLSSYELEETTPHTITDINKWVESLPVIKKQGYSFCDEELQIGIQGVACPIVNARGEAVASISFTVAKSDFNSLDETIALFKECAREISLSLGSKE